MPQREQGVRFRLADIWWGGLSFVSQGGYLADHLLPTLAIPQRHDSIAAQLDDESVIRWRGRSGLCEQRFEAGQRRVDSLEAIHGIHGGNRCGLVEERRGLARLDSRIWSRGVKARGERSSNLDEDAAHFATQHLVVRRKQPGREIRAERRV
jgi:hypothetical protein